MLGVPTWDQKTVGGHGPNDNGSEVVMRILVIVGCCHRIDQIERKTLNKYRDVLF